MTINMPSRNGNQTHQILGEHPARSLDDLLTQIADTDFFIVEEYYRDGTGHKSVGPIALNPAFIAKIKVPD